MIMLVRVDAKSFFLGAGFSLAVTLFVQKVVRVQKRGGENTLISKPVDDSRSRHEVSSPRADPQRIEKPVLFDSPDLNLRLIRKAEAVIQQRTSSVTVVVERCTSDHNYSAILRTAEALGIQNVWIIDPAVMNDGTGDDDSASESNDRRRNMPALHLTPDEIEQRRRHRLFAQNATEWITVRDFRTTTECLTALRETDHKIWVTDLSQKAVPLGPRDLLETGNWPLPERLAIVMGTEAVGCSQEILDAADLRIYLPLRGFADSLNLSVATALVIHHVFLLEPSYIGRMSEEERLALRQTWFPKLARQRILSRTEKRRRQKLLSKIHACKQIQAKQDAGHQVTTKQEEKLAKLSELREYLQELETSTNYNTTAVDRAVADLVSSPPEPLGDLRRADLHRVTFVGKNTKIIHKEHWKDMAATSSLQTPHLSTSSFFREMVEAVSVNNPSKE